MALFKRMIGSITSRKSVLVMIIFLLVTSIALPWASFVIVKKRGSNNYPDISSDYELNAIDVYEDEYTNESDSNNSSEVQNIKSDITSSSSPQTVKNSYDYTKITDYTTLKKWVYYFSRKYKDILKLYYYGTSVQSRQLFVLTIGNGPRKVLFNAGIHAREHITVNFTLRCIEEYCDAYYSSGYYGNYDLKELFSEFTLYIIPNCNPDGVEIITGKSSPSVPVVVNSWNSYKANANGVNLNRNFPYEWDSVDLGSSVPHEEKYKGSSPYSEPETRYLIGLCSSNHFEFLISLHIKGDCIYWDDVKNQSHIGWNLTKGLCNSLGFSACEITDDPNLYGGCFENWFAKAYKKPGLCVELMPSEIMSVGNSDVNLKDFDRSVRWQYTRYLFASALYQTL